jgi:hypothetical protein
MKIHILLAFLYLVISFSLEGCTYSPYRNEIYELYNVEPKELFRVHENGIAFDNVFFHIYFFYGPLRNKDSVEIHGGPYTIHFEASDISLRYSEIVIDEVKIESSLGNLYKTGISFPFNMSMRKRDDSQVWDLNKQALVNVPYHYCDSIIGGPYDFSPVNKELVTIITSIRAIRKDGETTHYSIKANFKPVINEGRFQSID